MLHAGYGLLNEQNEGSLLPEPHRRQQQGDSPYPLQRAPDSTMLSVTQDARQSSLQTSLPPHISGP